jgi:hypothetical protein
MVIIINVSILSVVWPLKNWHRKKEKRRAADSPQPQQPSTIERGVCQRWWQ